MFTGTTSRKLNLDEIIFNIINFADKEIFQTIVEILPDAKLMEIVSTQATSRNEAKDLKNTAKEIKKNGGLDEKLRQTIVLGIVKDIFNSPIVDKTLRILVRVLDEQTVVERTEVNRCNIYENFVRLTENSENERRRGKLYWALVCSENYTKKMLPFIYERHTLKVEPKFATKLVGYIIDDCYNLSEELTQADREIGELEKENSELEKKLRAFEERLRDKTEETKRLERTLNSQPTETIRTVAVNNGNSSSEQTREYEKQLSKATAEAEKRERRISNLEAELKTATEKLAQLRNVEREKAELEKELALQEYRGKKVCIIGGDKILDLREYEQKYGVEIIQILTDQKTAASIKMPMSDLYILKTAFFCHSYENYIDANADEWTKRRMVKLDKRGKGTLPDLLAKNVGILKLTD